jgi:thioester reductase-like protein
MHALITGFPGFIARRLVARLVQDDPGLTITALIQESMAEPARKAAEACGDGRVELVVGDIAEPHLGLSDEDWSRLAGRTGEVHHLAAVYDLAVPLDIAQRVNVDGTGNVLDFCRACKDLRQLHYVSTAYVAGDRTGVVYEHELFLGQKHKNHYEATKFQAEVWVREEMHRIPTTIYRPAIVVGDSRTGETQKFDGPYYLLRTISRSVRMHTPIMQFGRADAPFNVVPIDFVVDALAAISRDPVAIGETLHLVDPEPITAKEITQLLAREYCGRKPRLRLPAAVVRESLRAKPMRALYSGAPRESIVYLNHSVKFDTRRAEEVLGRHGLTPPRFPDYAPKIVEFFKAHEDDEALQPMK